MTTRIEAELAVLSAILLDNERGSEAFDVLQPTDFYVERHRMVFEAMAYLAEHGKPIDPVVLSARLKDTHDLDKVGMNLLADLMDAVPTAANVGHHARLIRRAAVDRRLLGAADTIRSIIEAQDLETDAAIAACENAVFDATDRHEVSASRSAASLVWDVVDAVKTRPDGEVRGIPSGLVDLDEMTDGWQRRAVTIIAARPSVGKTAFMLNAACAAAEAGQHCLIFSLEQSNDELVERSLAITGGVSFSRLRKSRLRDSDYPRLSHAMGVLGSYKERLTFDDNAVQNVGTIRAAARRYRRQTGRLDLLIVDYLQLMDAPGRHESKNEQVAAISRGLRAIAKDLDVPVLCLSQLNRETERRGNDRPRLSDLRDSGAIEQDADLVMFLWNDPAFKEMTNPPLTLIIGKHRNGPTGELRVLFEKPTLRFSSWSDREEAAA